MVPDVKCERNETDLLLDFGFSLPSTIMYERERSVLCEV